MTISPEEAQRLAKEILDEPDSPVPATADPIRPGSRIGRYTVESLIATGGMGAVYRAKHEHPARVVALKVVRPELLSAAAVRRFRHETELLGRLQHPGIAQIFEAGSVQTDLGEQPYFAMEYVQGQPIQDYADEANLSTRARLELFLEVCDAVEHAHRKGVIHRDLKPGNVLVTAQGKPKILDFGVAKATDADLQSTTLRTNIGQLVGTLPYMSPEQAAGDAADLDTRSDVYSLGVLLYQLLSGHLPYEIKKSAIAEALRAIQEEDPAPLSSIDKTLRGDIETIVGKALEKDRDRRYQGASDLAADIRRFLANETITARPASAWYQVSKFARRNRAVTAAFAAIVIVVVIGSTVSIRFGIEKAVALREADRQATRAIAVSGFLTNLVQSAHPESENRDIRVSEMLRNAEQVLAESPVDDPQTEIEIRKLLAELFSDLDFRDDAATHYLRLLQLYDDTSDPTGVERVDARLALGQSYRYTGELSLARECFEQARSFAEKKLGKEHRTYWIANGNLGLLLLNEGRSPEAGRILQETWDEFVRRDGEDGKDALWIATPLTQFMLESGDLEGARDLLEHVVIANEREKGPNDLDTLSSKNQLATMYFETGEPTRGEALLLEVNESLTELYGPAHVGSLTTLYNLGIHAKLYGQPKVAIERLERVVANSETEHGPVNATALDAKLNLSDLYYDQGRIDEAIQLRTQVIQARTQLLGETHPYSLTPRVGLAIWLKEKGELERAETVLRDLMVLESNAVDAPSHREAKALNILVDILWDLGDREEAERVIHEFVNRAYPKPRPQEDVLVAQRKLAWVFNYTGRQDEAWNLLETSLRNTDAVADDVLYAPARIVGLMARISRENGDVEKMLDLVQEWIQRVPQSNGENRIAVGVLYEEQGYAEKFRGNEQKAIESLSRAYELQSGELGDREENVQRVVATLVELLESTGDTENADHFRELLVADESLHNDPESDSDR